MKVYILFIWLATNPHPKAYQAFQNYGDCLAAADVANAGRKPLAYCEEVRLK